LSVCFISLGCSLIPGYGCSDGEYRHPGGVAKRKEGLVAVLVLFKWEGDPDELLAAYGRELVHPVPRGQPQRISHICARANDSMMIVDVWQSREDFQKMMDDPEFQKNQENTKTPKLVF
jgi:hypothetical protein